MRIHQIMLGLWLGSVLWGQAPQPPAEGIAESERPRPSLEEQWGVRIESIRLTAGDHMIDFRYRVINPEKARPLFARTTKPYLLEQASGAKTEVPNMPKVGPLRNSNEPEANKVYWMFFGNMNKQLKSGAKVTVVIGDYRTETLTLE